MLTQDQEVHQLSFLEDEPEIDDQVLVTITREEIVRAIVAHRAARLAVGGTEPFLRSVDRAIRRLLSRIG
ncbi:MAG: hypothetical protein K2Y37_22770 [Pirellulales bacterium]|nr:hypothetical protein [Pirellulales bacterium]